MEIVESAMRQWKSCTRGDTMSFLAVGMRPEIRRQWWASASKKNKVSRKMITSLRICAWIWPTKNQYKVLQLKSKNYSSTSTSSSTMLDLHWMSFLEMKTGSKWLSQSIILVIFIWHIFFLIWSKLLKKEESSMSVRNSTIQPQRTCLRTLSVKTSHMDRWSNTTYQNSWMFCLHRSFLEKLANIKT